MRGGGRRARSLRPRRRWGALWAPLVAWVSASLLAALLPAPAPAQDAGAAGTEGTLYLLLPIGARSVALGRTMTAMEGPEGVWWNPAGVSREPRSRFQVHRGEDLAGEATSLSALFARPALGVMGVSYQLTDLGEIERRDNQGNFLGTVFIRNHTGILTLASEFPGGLAAGVNLKLLQQRVTCRGQCDDPGVDATTLAFDAGVQWRDVLRLPLVLGAAVVHAGPDVQFFNEEQADPLPTRLRVAAAYDLARHFVDSPELQAILSVELEDRWRDPGNPATYVGAEVAAGGAQALVVRAGYVFGAQLQVDGAAVGVGLRYDRIDLGIAKSLATTITGETEPVYLTLGVLF